MEDSMTSSANRFQVVEAMIVLRTNMVHLLKTLSFPPAIDTGVIVPFEHLRANELPFVWIALLKPLGSTHDGGTQNLSHLTDPFCSEKSLSKRSFFCLKYGFALLGRSLSELI